MQQLNLKVKTEPVVNGIEAYLFVYWKSPHCYRWKILLISKWNDLEAIDSVK